MILNEEQSISIQLRRLRDIEHLVIHDKDCETLDNGEEDILREFEKSINFVDDRYRLLENLYSILLGVLRDKKHLMMYKFSLFASLSRINCSKEVHTSSLLKALHFTQEHVELRKTVNKIIEKDINPYVDEWEKQKSFPVKEVFKKLGNAGLFGITRSTKYGGLGLDYSFHVAFLEELMNINCYGIPSSIIVHTDMGTPALARFGSEELKQEFLVPTHAGEMISCVGVSENHAGSDVANILTKAERKGDELIINGGKIWITNGAQADWMCLLANTREGPTHKNKSLICVPLNLPGITCNKIQMLGNDSCDTAEFFLEDVRVPAKNIIGEEGKGFIYQMQQFQDERLALSVTACSAMKRYIQETIDYCKERKAFGGPIINNQAIQFTLVELHTEVEAVRSLVYRAAEKIIEGQDATLLATMAKLKCGRLLREVTDKCLQFWGGMGYSSDAFIGRAFRDGRALSLAGGTDEIMLNIISKYMGLHPKSKPNTSKC
ncbi:probable acyl-CoA dehydrogenase 6 [Nephila pilipes]|uniref:Probable acyl-CoA dehydrogenase 6 n=1 Tax=Nephila pilipes TaxID=299642 RepID=A0A8X6PV35_NEPPI|nr:probable acyl-CoA dehydrogenase 6 [Nephila pilipes]